MDIDIRLKEIEREFIILEKDKSQNHSKIARLKKERKALKLTQALEDLK